MDAQVVDADIGDLGQQAHSVPESLQIYNWLAGNIAREQERAAFGHCIAARPDQGDDLVRDRHPVDAALFGTGRLLGTRSPDRG